MIDQQSTQWYQSAVDQLTQIAAAIQRQNDLDLKKVLSIASDIVESISRSDQLVVEALAGPGGSQLITNMINVGIFATKVGVGLGYDGIELERLALAGLVHDIGLLAIPQSLLTKAGRLTPEERMLIEQHPELGYQPLRKLGTTHEWLAEVVLHAHERWNGQGYPNKLKGRQINEFAQIIGVADVFDALVSPRPYRRRFRPHEAVREIVAVERAAFPRETIKALVEQLSAYPIGTSVRLSTGELGTVVRVNTHFPLRPVVLIDEGRMDGSAARQVDLSASPRASIETAEPSEVARTLVPMQIQDGRQAEPVTSVSDRFSAHLRSLEAIAHVIQEVVELVSPPRQGIDRLSEGNTMWPHRRTPAQELVNPSFEKVVVGLFVLEAHEWLEQITRALKKLTEGDNHAVRSDLYGSILQAIINLAKAAATVQLPAIERMAKNLLPILHEVERQDMRSPAALNWLHESLARMSTAIHRLTNDHAEQAIVQLPNGEHSLVVDPSSHPLSNRREMATQHPVVQSSSEASEPPLLNALRALHQARARSVQPTRDILEAVILRAEHEAGEIGVSVIERILNELHRLDEQFLHDVNRRVPVIIQTLHFLRSGQTPNSVTTSHIDPIVHEVDALYDLANRVQASMMIMFLHSLRSVLFVGAYRKASTLPQWAEMIEARVHSLVPMAEQWVNIGRTERADISDILRA
jgi:hypothetical protein